MLTGIVNCVRRGTFCYIRTPAGTDYWAHKNSFLDPSLMKEGQLVRFTPVQILLPGKGPEATNVMAVELIAA